jgi:hypothetical protein
LHTDRIESFPSLQQKGRGAERNPRTRSWDCTEKVQPTTRPAGTLAPGVASAGLSEEPWKEFSKRSPLFITERALKVNNPRLHNIDHLPDPGWGAISENHLPLPGSLFLPGTSPGRPSVLFSPKLGNYLSGRKTASPQERERKPRWIMDGPHHPAAGTRRGIG